MVWIDPKESISQTMERTFQTISVEWYAKGLLTPVKTKFFSTLGSGVPFTLDVNTELVEGVIIVSCKGNAIAILKVGDDGIFAVPAGTVIDWERMLKFLGHLLRAEDTDISTVVSFHCREGY